MAGKIPQHFIDDLLDRVDIVDLVNSRVQLKKTGKNYSACCPFHDEKTPSFTVSPDKQFYYCFGCQASGHALGFVMDYDRLSFPEAVEQLARDQGMDVPREETTPLAEERARHKKRQYDVLNKADQFYRRQLRQHADAGRALDYLKQRGLSGRICATFGIGYAPPGWNNLLEELGDDPVSLRLQAETGMLIEKPAEHKRYDRFRNRIMFPIRDTRGRTIAFGGRVLGDDKPKYLNSPETPVFHKGRELYGLYELNQQQREPDHILVVEGYMDVVALAQCGIDYAVATLGTAITADHLDKLFRYSPEAVFCFDGDAAGARAARRALEHSLPLMTDGRAAKFLFLPAGEDPDSLVRDIGAERFRDRVKTAAPLSQFLFDTLSDGLDTDTPDGKARLARLAAPHLNKIPAGVFRELMVDQLAAITGLGSEKLNQLLLRGPAPRAQPGGPQAGADSYSQGYSQQQAPDFAEQPPPPASAPPWQADPPVAGRKRRKMQFTPERTAIAILLDNPQLARQVDDTGLLSQSDSQEVQLLAGLLEHLQQQPDTSFHQLLGHWLGVHRDGQGAMLAEIAACDAIHPPSHAARDNRAEFQDALKLIRRRAMQAMPLAQQVATLLDKSDLEEQDFKTALRILPSVQRSGLDQEIKSRLNQLIRRKK